MCKQRCQAFLFLHIQNLLIFLDFSIYHTLWWGYYKPRNLSIQFRWNTKIAAANHNQRSDTGHQLDHDQRLYIFRSIGTWQYQGWINKTNKMPVTRIELSSSAMGLTCHYYCMLATAPEACSFQMSLRLLSKN